MSASLSPRRKLYTRYHFIYKFTHSFLLIQIINLLLLLKQIQIILLLDVFLYHVSSYNNKLHLIVFLFKSFTFAECNYPIYDIELFAI